MDIPFNTRAQAKRPNRAERRDTEAQSDSSWILKDVDETLEQPVLPETEEPQEPAGNAEAMPFAFPGLGDDEEEAPRPANVIDIKRLLIGVWNRKWLVIIIAAIVTSLFLAAAIFLVNKSWTSKSVLIKREQIDQFQIGGGKTPFELQNYSFETMLDTLKLPSMLQLALERSQVEAKTTQFAAAIGLIKGKTSNLFQIMVTWDDPVVATTLANNLVGAFLENNRTMRREEATSIYNYYSAQLSEVEGDANDLDRQIQDFQRDKGVINFDRQSEVALRQISELEVEYRSMLAELEEIKRNEGDLAALIEQTPEMTIQQTLYKNPLKQQLSSLEWELEQARGRYTDENPKVLDLLDRIASLKLVIAEGGDEDTPENIYALNPVRETLMLKQLDNRDVIAIKSALAQSLKGSLDDSRRILEDLTESYRTYSALVQERESLSDLLGTLRNRVEEARIIMQGNNSDFELIESAAIPQESNPTPKKLIAIAGAVLGGGLGVFVALLLEFLDPRVKTRREVAGLTCAERVYEIQSLPDYVESRCGLSDPDSDMALLVRRLLNNLESELDRTKHRVLPITSLERDVGRSDLARNLAVVSCHKEQQTTLIDADLSENAGNRSVEAGSLEGDCDQSGIGLADYLNSEAELSQLNHPTELEGLEVIPAGSGSAIGRAAILKLSNSRMRALVDGMTKGQRRLVLDLPPISRYEPVFELVSRLGQTILVVKSGSTRKSDLKQFAERAERAGIEILAVIVTDVAPDLISEREQFVFNG